MHGAGINRSVITSGNEIVAAIIASNVTVVPFTATSVSQAAAIACLDAADVEDDGRVTVLDAIRLVLYLFAGGQEPEAPFAAPGPDPTADGLGCGR